MTTGQEGARVERRCGPSESIPLDAQAARNLGKERLRGPGTRPAWSIVREGA